MRFGLKRGISLSQIERDLNMSNGSISKWNSSAPNFLRVIALVDYIGISLNEFRDLVNSIESD